MSPDNVLLFGAWRKTTSWRVGAFFVGGVSLIWALDLFFGDSIDVFGLWRPLALFLLGIVLSIPYGWAWTQGDAPPPPSPPTLLPQAALDAPAAGNTYVLVGPQKMSYRPWLPRKVGPLGPVSWFLYTVFWRVPVTIGDAILTPLWRLMTRIFGFNGGPSVETFDPASLDEIDYPEDLPPPDETF